MYAARLRLHVLCMWGLGYNISYTGEIQCLYKCDKTDTFLMSVTLMMSRQHRSIGILVLTSHCFCYSHLCKENGPCGHPGCRRSRWRPTRWQHQTLWSRPLTQCAMSRCCIRGWRSTNPWCCVVHLGQARPWPSSVPSGPFPTSR